MAMLTQDELDKLPHGSPIWYIGRLTMRAEPTQMDCMWQATDSDYFLTQKEAQDHIDITKLIEKLKGGT